MSEIGDMIRVKNVVGAQLRAYGNHILVTDMEQGYGKSKSGLITGTIEGHDKTTGMLSQRLPRWCRVLSIGEGSKWYDRPDLKPGDWVMVEFNRWTPAMELGDGTILNGIDENSIMVIHEDDGSGPKPDFNYTEDNLGAMTDETFKHVA